MALGRLLNLLAFSPWGSLYNEPRQAQVIILGGGVAGISLARALIADNITDILLLEGRDELGGRAYTETLHNCITGQDIVVEKGCNWIQGPGKEPIIALADKWGIKTTRQNYSDTAWFGDYDGDAQRGGHWLDEEEEDAFMDEYDSFLQRAPAYSAWRTNHSLVDVSVRVATAIMDWLPTTALQTAYEYWNIDYTFAQPPEDSSFANTFGQEAGIENEVDDFVVDQRGFKHMFLQEARQVFGEYLDDPRLQLGTTVLAVDYSGDSIVVVTDKGNFSAPHVVSTFSVGVLQHQDVRFVPRLPDWKKEAIFTFAMATYQKIFLLFEEQFWGGSQFSMYADREQRGRYAVWQNMNAEGFFPQNTSSNIIMVTATDRFARRNEYRSDDKIEAEVMDVLREMYGDDIPDPLDMIVPRWTLDPFYRGSYSNWPLGASVEHHRNLGQPVSANGNWLHFTGEAMSEDKFGYVQGAWEEGIKTAGIVAQCLRGTCPIPPVDEAISKLSKGKVRPVRRHAIPKRGRK